MIKDPQIFILYEPGMMGTFFCNLLLFQEELIGNNAQRRGRAKNKNSEYNLHETVYKDTLKNFHTSADFKKIKDKASFFAPLENKGISIHRLSSWEFLRLDYPKYFSNYVIGLIVPSSEDNCINWAERSIQANPETIQMIESEWWYKNVGDITKVPKPFIDGMRLKERKKYLKSHYDTMTKVKLDNRTVKFNIDHIGVDSIQQFCNQCCNTVNIKPFDVPKDFVNKYLQKNSIFLNKKFDITGN